jgi:hypothetical protein
VVDGNRLDRVFDIFGSGPSSIQVTFRGLTIRGGGLRAFSPVLLLHVTVTETAPALGLRAEGGAVTAYVSLIAIHVLVFASVGALFGGGLGVLIAILVGGKGPTLIGDGLLVLVLTGLIALIVLIAACVFLLTAPFPGRPFPHSARTDSRSHQPASNPTMASIG